MTTQNRSVQDVLDSMDKNLYALGEAVERTSTSGSVEGLRKRLAVTNHQLVHINRNLAALVAIATATAEFYGVLPDLTGNNQAEVN